MNIQQILSGIENQAMVMPEFQREYVWSLDNAKQLLVSLFRGYPTGSLLFWNAKQDNIPEIKNNAIDRDKIGAVNVILDGQQRITTLYLLITGEIPPYYTEDDLENDPRHLYFNMMTGEFQYFMKSKMSENPVWQKVIDCFNLDKINAYDISSEYSEKYPDKDFKEVMKIVNNNLNKLRTIPNIDYPIQNVPSDALIDEAIDVFDRVNSRGTKLTDAELVLTHITGQWPHARRVMKEKAEKLEAFGFKMELDLLTRLFVIALTGSALYKKNAKLKYSNFTKEDYQKAWGRIDKALDYILPILKNDAYIFESHEMNTLNVLVPIIAYLLNNNLQFTQKLKFGFLYWMFLALVWSRYSGQTDQKLDRDVYLAINSQDPIGELVDEIKDQRGRIIIETTDLEGRGAGHPLYRMLFIISKWNGATDWANGSPLQGTIGDWYSIQSHHIFPQAVLYKNGYSSENHLDKKKVNEIANRAFITRDTNYQISDTLPSIYMPKIKSQYPGALTKHFIPDNPELWEVENYSKFLKERRSLIVKKSNEFLNYLYESSNNEETAEINTDWISLISKGESNFLEFKSSIRWDYKQSTINKDLEHVIAKTIASFLNSDGGKLIIGVDDNEMILGLKKDYKTLGSKQNKDGFLLRMDDLVNTYLGKEFHEYITITIEEIGEQDICIVEISDSNKPTYVKGENRDEFYIRASASSQSLGMREASEYISSHWD